MACSRTIRVDLKGREHCSRRRDAKMITTAIQWNYTTFVNIIFLVLTAILVIRFMRTGGFKAQMSAILNVSQFSDFELESK